MKKKLSNLSKNTPTMYISRFLSNPEKLSSIDLSNERTESRKTLKRKNFQSMIFNIIELLHEPTSRIRYIWSVEIIFKFRFTRYNDIQSAD